MYLSWIIHCYPIVLFHVLTTHDKYQKKEVIFEQAYHKKWRFLKWQTACSAGPGAVRQVERAPLYVKLQCYGWKMWGSQSE